MLVFILALVGAYAVVAVWQQRSLSAVVQDSALRQQASIADVSEETMEAMLSAFLTQNTALQAYIADDLFGEVRTDVLTLQAFASELFSHADSFSPHPFYPPDPANAGIPSVQMQHEAGVDPADSEALGLAANMSEIMLAMFQNSDKLNSCFVATTDGCILFVDDRAEVYFAEDGTIKPAVAVSERPWFRQAAEAGDVIFTDVEADTFSGILGVVCAAPVYRDGELAAVVGADIFLTSISDYVEETATEGGFLCVINEKGQVLFSPETSGVFKAQLSGTAPDLRTLGSGGLARVVTEALGAQTGLQQISVDKKEYYLAGAPLSSVGWAVLSVVEKELTRQPADAMLAKYDEINALALGSYRDGAARSARTILVLTLVIVLLALSGALVLASRIVKPVERMTRRINSLQEGEGIFEMEDAYRTGDEIQVLAESFASLSTRARDYIAQITAITAEKERIGTELALATRIQADMLPNIFPAFPERPDFDIYAVMDPAKEVGGDFYDFFLIDEDHLGIVMADVSGKGVPAALFMMVSKILVQNYTMMGYSPARVLQTVNDQFCANNREEMFVTVWLGVLDTRTGRITAANAGHEYPVLKPAGGQFELVKDKHGLVVGGMEGVRYKEYEMQLAPGAKLFLYTDGVPEATDAKKELFGTERMLRALNDLPDASPEEVLKQVRRAVDGFVKDAEQFDDLTMLCLEYRGGG
ncbi:MAG: SpoIIE family protein phosphatase [Oscillospiraceae bacterium]|nr:SpoIIE family protein phosphatase [Oscillospiraceae bacterium]